MNTITQIQLSSFCDKKIALEPENISSYMRKLQEINIVPFLPNTLPSLKFDIKSNNFVNEPVILFSTKDNDSVVFGENGRIDCTFNYINKQQSKFDRCFDSCAKIVDFIMDGETFLPIQI